MHNIHAEIIKFEFFPQLTSGIFLLFFKGKIMVNKNFENRNGHIKMEYLTIS